MRTTLLVLSTVATLGLSSSFAVADSSGALSGAAGGAAVGAVVGGPVGAVVGGGAGAIVGGAASGPEASKTVVVHEHDAVPVEPCTSTSTKETTYGVDGAQTTRTDSTTCP